MTISSYKKRENHLFIVCYIMKEQYNMIKIIVSEDGVPFIWNSNDWLTLRKDHRIVGNLSGAPHIFPKQESLGHLPVVLFPYEATLLQEKRIAQLVRYPSLLRAPGKGVKEEYDKYRKRIINEQIEYFESQNEGRVSPCEENERIEGQMSPNDCQKKSFSVSRDLPSANSQISSANNEMAMSSYSESIGERTRVQIFTTYPWLRLEDACTVKWRYPSTTVDVLCFKIYRDLWEKGYYVTSGLRLGCDFLVYPGDPFITPAHFLIVCVARNAVVRPVDIASLCRLGVSVKKSVVFASESDNNQIIYQSLECCSQNR